MGLVRTADQRMIAETARAFLAEQSGSAARRRALEAGWDADLWARMTQELGWAAIAIPEAYGGAGLGWADLAVLMEEAGRELAMAPLFATCGLAAPLILAAGDEAQKAAIMPKLAAGAAATACLSPATVKLRGEPGAWRLDGEAAYVAHGHVAELLVVTASGTGEGESLVVLKATAPGVTITRRDSLDLTRPLSSVRFEGAAVEDALVLGAPGRAHPAIERGLAVARAMLAAEQVGAAEMCLETTRDYVGQRVQFGRPVGSFQAVKHRLADMAVQIETARSAAAWAADACDRDGAELHGASDAARAFASRAFERCAADAIQLHGGIGFTWEHDAHLYFKRARSAATLLGDVSSRLDALAEIIGLGTSEPVPA
jgi:alkylation response protein AidB-like acyl-CoA dehydrogenase